MGKVKGNGERQKWAAGGGDSTCAPETDAMGQGPFVFS